MQMCSYANIYPLIDCFLTCLLAWLVEWLKKKKKSFIDSFLGCRCNQISPWKTTLFVRWGFHLEKQPHKQCVWKKEKKGKKEKTSRKNSLLFQLIYLSIYIELVQQPFCFCFVWFLDEILRIICDRMLVHRDIDCSSQLCSSFGDKTALMVSCFVDVVFCIFTYGYEFCKYN